MVVYVAWCGQQLGDLYLGGYLSGFVGALAMTPAAFLLERVRSAPPFLVLLLPAFWLLLPGVLAVVGLADWWAATRRSPPPTLARRSSASSQSLSACS
ncbi:MAG: hypothetical protein JO023_13400 [Chloroflexi bacterium]|nr:hypothetical protein [Chloroflexota bacterium]